MTNDERIYRRLVHLHRVAVALACPSMARVLDRAALMYERGDTDGASMTLDTIDTPADRLVALWYGEAA